jgi:hypothetical protein
MAWFEAHQTLARHPKTLKLASLLKVERRYAVGLLHDLFSWGLDSAKKDGTLPGLNAEEIASALDYSGKKGSAVINALVESGYLELQNGSFRIHDWYDYAGKLMDKREADRKRKSNGNPTEIQQNSNGIPIATVPNLTVPNQEDNNSFFLSDEKLAEVMSFYLDNIEPDARHIDFIKASVEKKGADRVFTALKKCEETGKKTFPWVMKVVNDG